jgi:hypothetical protein
MNGDDARIPDDRESGVVAHTLLPVHSTMLLQIALDYPGVPDVRQLRASELRFFYDGLRGSLKQRTKARK